MIEIIRWYQSRNVMVSNGFMQPAWTINIWRAACFWGDSSSWFISARFERVISEPPSPLFLFFFLLSHAPLPGRNSSFLWPHSHCSILSYSTSSLSVLLPHCRLPPASTGAAVFRDPIKMSLVQQSESFYMFRILYFTGTLYSALAQIDRRSWGLNKGRGKTIVKGFKGALL